MTSLVSSKDRHDCGVAGVPTGKSENDLDPYYNGFSDQSFNESERPEIPHPHLCVLRNWFSAFAMDVCGMRPVVACCKASNIGTAMRQTPMQRQQQNTADRKGEWRGSTTYKHLSSTRTCALTSLHLKRGTTTVLTNVTIIPIMRMSTSRTQRPCSCARCQACIEMRTDWPLRSTERVVNTGG